MLRRRAKRQCGVVVRHNMGVGKRRGRGRKLECVELRVGSDRLHRLSSSSDSYPVHTPSNRAHAYTARKGREISAVCLNSLPFPTRQSDLKRRLRWR